MVRHGLDDELRRVTHRIPPLAHSVAAHAGRCDFGHAEALKDQLLPVDPVKHLAQPVHKQRLVVFARSFQPVLLAGLDRFRL
jgi:hypothetical protein